jgi:hypothetical protein
MEDYNTKFKKELIEKLNNKGLTNSTINLYLRNLEKLNEGPLKNLKFLNDPNKILEKLEDYKENTKRLYLISICSVLNVEDKTKLYDKYFKLMINKNKELKEQEATNEPSQQQSKNWLSWEEVINKHNELKQNIIPIIENKPKLLSLNKYNDILKYLILSLYVLMPPRRNSDYQFMNVRKTDTDDTTKNYLILDNKQFYFNKYKTQKKFGKQIEDIPEELMEIIELYLKYHPLVNDKKYKKSNIKTLDEPFLVYYNSEPLNKVNSITRILNSIFEKNLGSSMLRHIYLSNKYEDVIEEQKKDANAMAHSVEMQKNYVKKIK